MRFENVGRQLLIIGAAVVALLVVRWYLTVYDTAEGKCQRGDLDACVVWEAENATPIPVITTAPRPPAAQMYNCYASVPDHDAVAGIYGASSCAQIQSLLSVDGFQAASSAIPSTDHMVCSVNGTDWYVEVWDDGGTMYGGEACDTLTAAASP